MKCLIIIKMVCIYIIEIFFIMNIFNLFYRIKVRERERFIKIGMYCSVFFDFFFVSKIFVNIMDLVMMIKISYVRFKSF